MKQRLVKSITLISFFGLITLFVCYRSGVFGDKILKSPNGSPVNTIIADSAKTAPAKTPGMFSSSKTIILSDEAIPAGDTSIIDSALFREFEIMGSSKSGLIISPDFPDSSDTTK